MRPLRVAVWGIGRHAQKRILPVLHAFPGTTIAALISRSTEVGQREAKRYGAVAHNSPEGVLRDASIDVVYVATPIGLHATHVTMALEHGKHVWCEKALCGSVEAAGRMVALAKARGRHLVETFMYLYNPQHRAVSAEVRLPAFGELQGITCHFYLPPSDDPGFRDDPALGGGCLLDVGCYPISVVTQLAAGMPKVLSAAIRAPEGGVDTDGHALLSFADGPLAYLTWGYQRAYVNELHLQGSFASLRVERVFSKHPGIAAPILRRDVRGAASDVPYPEADSFACMLEALCNDLRTATDPTPQHEAALHRARVMDAVRKAAGFQLPGANGAW